MVLIVPRMNNVKNIFCAPGNAGTGLLAQNIDIDLNLIRELPINFYIDSVRWYFQLTGVHGELDQPYLLNVLHLLYV